MDEVAQLIKEHLGSPDYAFVFPSEVAADFWRRRFLELSPRRAVWHERFLSWDRFKEETFALSRESVPVNRVTRTLFVSDLLHRNAVEKPMFTTIIRPRFAESSESFLGAITSLLPELGRFRETAEDAAARAGVSPRAGDPPGFGLLDPALAADLDVLWRRYADFLERHGMFEPSYERVKVKDLRRSYLVFFPEVIEDWTEFAAGLVGPRVRPIATAASEPVPIVRFANAKQELRHLVLRLCELLDSGVRPDEIAVTVGDLPGWERELRFQADLHALPLDIRQGRPLAEYPEVRLFSNVHEAVAGGFSLDSLKELFLNRGIPWRNGEIARALVQFGVAHHCVRRIESADLWLEAFASVGGEGRTLREFYTGISRELSALVASRRFAELKRRLQRFIRGRLDTALWPARSLAIFQFALDALNDLIEAEERTEELVVTSPYRLWMTYLSQRIYVPRPDRRGVPVYPYRVSAGISPRHHFLIGATENATRVEWPVLAFLRDDERLRLQLPERTATEAFFALYAQSARKMFFSFSREDAGGVELPPGYFVVRRRVVEAGTGEVMAGVDSYDREREIWSGAAAPASRCFPAQSEGAAYFAVTAASTRRDDLTRAPLSNAALAGRLRELLSDESGRLSLSPSRLDRFLDCPFAFLFSDPLAVRDDEYAIVYDDPLRIGRIMHECFRLFFERLRSESGGFDPAQVPLYRQWVETIVTELFDERGGGEDALIPPVWNALRRRLEALFDLFFAEEAERYPGLKIFALESEYDAPFDEGITIGGRIDRVSGSGDSLLLVDYKRRVNPRMKRALTALVDARAGVEAAPPAVEDDESASSEELPSLQVPFYIELLAAAGRTVGEACYYDVERGGYQQVYHPSSRSAWTGAEGMDTLRTYLRAAIRAMDDRLRRGDYRAPDGAGGCEGCTARRICRMKYTVR